MPARRKAPARKPSRSTPARPAARPRAARASPRAAPRKAARAQGRIGTLRLVTLHVNDFGRAREFYRDTLGLRVTEEMPEAGWIEFDVGPLKLGVHADPGRQEPGAREPGHASGLYFQVPDVDATVRELRERGVKITDEPGDMPYGREAYFADPDGNVMAVLTPRA